MLVAMAYFSRSGSLLRIEGERRGKLVVFGDIHGDYEALRAGAQMAGEDDLLLFLGDFADRGPYGVEVIEAVKTMVEAGPETIAAIKGNHEVFDESGNPAFSPCTLIPEAEEKRGGWIPFYRGIADFFAGLPLAAILPGSTLFVHAGISETVENEQNLEYPDAELQERLYWSDPGPGTGEKPSPRGAGRVFGKDVTRRVCDALGVKRIVRSHEPRKAVAGPKSEHESRIVTVSATRVYGGKAFVLVFDLAKAGEPETLFLDL